MSGGGFCLRFCLLHLCVSSATSNLAWPASIPHNTADGYGNPRRAHNHKPNGRGAENPSSISDMLSANVKKTEKQREYPREQSYTTGGKRNIAGSLGKGFSLDSKYALYYQSNRHR